MRMYRNMVGLMAGLMIFLGVGMLSFTIANGGGVGILLGVLFIAAGVGRIWMLRRRG